MALSTHTKTNLDKAAPGLAAAMVTVINTGSTTGIAGEFRSKLEHILGGIGEAAAFLTACSTQGTLSQAAKNRLEHYLRGAGEVASFQTAISGQSA